MKKRIALIAAISLIFISLVGIYLWKIKVYNPSHYVRYASLATTKLCIDCEMLIPKKIHRIWTVWNPKKPHMPQVYKDFDAQFKALHPDFEIIEWNDEKILAFLTEHYPEFLKTYLSYDVPVKKHDAIRYLIVNHFGGVFLQHSVYLYKNLGDLLRGATFVASEESAEQAPFYSYEIKRHVQTNTIPCGFFASVPNHPILQAVIQSLPKRKDKYVLDATGPRLLSVHLYEYFKNTQDLQLKVLDRQFLLPFDWNEKKKEPYFSNCIKKVGKSCRKVTPDSYGYCLWSGAWVKPAQLASQNQQQ